MEDGEGSAVVKVILLKDVPGLGSRGQVKEVKEGYARNYLLPRRFAAEATAGSVRAVEGEQKAADSRVQRERTEVEHLTAQLSQIVVEIRAKAGEGGRLFGAVTAQQVADALAARGFRVSKRQVELDEPIKTAGFYKVQVRVSQGMVARIDLNVVGTA